jgi:hypothetical protein
MKHLPVLIADKLGLLIPRLASDHDGEVVATARAIQRTLAAEKLDLHDLAATLAPESRRGGRWGQLEPDEKFAALDRLGTANLTAWECQFVASIREVLTADPSRVLSEKQVAVVERLLARTSGRRAA